MDILTGENRDIIYNDLKNKFEKQVGIMKGFTKTNISKEKASYEVALQIAKNGKSFRDGEVIKKCAIKMALAFGNEQIARDFESVACSHQTVSRKF